MVTALHGDSYLIKLKKWQHSELVAVQFCCMYVQSVHGCTMISMRVYWN